MIKEFDILDSPLFNELRKGYIHVTSIKSYTKIIADRYIRPNYNNYPFTFPQTVNSICYLLEGISLFDFEQPNRILFENVTIDHFSKFFTIHKPITIILQLNKNNLKDKIIPNEVLKDKDKTVIPNVEVCYKGKISVNHIEKCIMVCGYDKNIFVIVDGKLLKLNMINHYEKIIKEKYRELHEKYISDKLIKIEKCMIVCEDDKLLKIEMIKDGISFSDMIAIEKYNNIKEWLSNPD